MNSGTQIVSPEKVSDLQEEKEHGKIHNRERAKQLILFDRLIYARKCAPTDIDMLFDYYGMGWIIGEAKVKGATLEKGQRIAMERFVDDMTAAGKPAYAILFEHTKFEPEEDVHAWECLVRKIRKPNEKFWRTPNRTVNVKETLEYIFGLIDDEDTWKQEA